MPTLSHACVRVLDLARSVAFYRETLGLTPQRELTMEDRGWHLVFLGDGVTPFQLELCGSSSGPSPTAWGMTPPMWPSCPGLPGPEGQAPSHGADL